MTEAAHAARGCAESALGLVLVLLLGCAGGPPLDASSPRENRVSDEAGAAGESLAPRNPGDGEAETGDDDRSDSAGVADVTELYDTSYDEPDIDDQDDSEEDGLEEVDESSEDGDFEEEAFELDEFEDEEDWD